MDRRGFVTKMLAAGLLQRGLLQADDEARRIGPEVRISGPGWYDGAVDNSAPIREERYRQLERAIHKQLRESDRLRGAFWSGDLRSIPHFERSQRKLREAYFRMIGYPPPVLEGYGQPRATKAGEDREVTVYRIFVPALDGIETYGMLFIPRLQKFPPPCWFASTEVERRRRYFAAVTTHATITTSPGERFSRATSSMRLSLRWCTEIT